MKGQICEDCEADANKCSVYVCIVVIVFLAVAITVSMIFIPGFSSRSRWD